MIKTSREMERAYYEPVELQIDENVGMTVYTVRVVDKYGNGYDSCTTYRTFQVFDNENTAKAVVNGLNKGVL